MRMLNDRLAPTLVVELREIAEVSIRTLIESLKEISITFPQLQAIVEVVSSVVSIVNVRVLLVQTTPSGLLTVSQQRFSQDEEVFQALRRKLEAIMSIVEHYQKHGSMGALESRIKDLSPFVMSDNLRSD